MPKLPSKVYARNRESEGKPTGGTRWCSACQRSSRIGVRWGDGKLTFPCTRAMIQDDPEEWVIA